MKEKLKGIKEDWVEVTIEDIKKDSLIGLVRSRGQQNNPESDTPYLKMNDIDMVGHINTENLVSVSTNVEEKIRYQLNKQHKL